MAAILLDQIGDRDDVNGGEETVQFRRALGAIAEAEELCFALMGSCKFRQHKTLGINVLCFNWAGSRRQRQRKDQLLNRADVGWIERIPRALTKQSYPRKRATGSRNEWRSIKRPAGQTHDRGMHVKTLIERPL